MKSAKRGGRSRIGKDFGLDRRTAHRQPTPGKRYSTCCARADEAAAGAFGDRSTRGAGFEGRRRSRHRLRPGCSSPGRRQAMEPAIPDGEYAFARLWRARQGKRSRAASRCRTRKRPAIPSSVRERKAARAIMAPFENHLKTPESGFRAIVLAAADRSNSKAWPSGRGADERGGSPHHGRSDGCKAHR